jgi:SAM-dependent methyltransferase
MVHIPSGIEVLEGGAGVGKSTYLRELEQLLIDEGYRVYFINASSAMSEWFKELPLPLKKTDVKVNYILNTLPEEFYLLVDNADSIPNTSGNKKYAVIEKLLFKAKGAVIACQHFNNLSPSLKARLKNCKRLYAGSGALGFDVTYILLAVIVIVVALIGQHHLIFIAAALRYMFQGMRIGGRV